MDLIIPYQDVTITVNGVYQTTSDPIQGINVYLFTPTGAYMGQYLTTGANGQVTFYLPERAYKVRADYQFKQFWSNEFTAQDTDVDIPLADAQITVTGNGLPLSGVPVYVFTQTGSYLGINDTTDGNGQVLFRLSAGDYKYRADYQGSQYWSTETTLIPDQINPIDISTGGGALTVTVQKNTSEPLSDVNCYVFTDTGAYLGLTDTTDNDGNVIFYLSDGYYKVRTDYMGYSFWTLIYQVQGNLSVPLTIDHTDVTVSVQKTFQGTSDPVVAVPVYLFTPSGSYLGISQTTDISGQTIFNLPNQTYKVRANYLSGEYWSNEFTGADTVIDIPLADADIYVSWNDQPLENLPVYVFTDTGSYLGITDTTDAQGEIVFRLPAETYKFRADYFSNPYWSGEHELQSDVVNEIDIFTGGGTFNLTVLKDQETPMVGDKTYLFNPTGAYLGVFNTLDANGQVDYDLPEGSYQFRVDTLGYQFWTGLYDVPDELADVFTIPHQDVTITVQALDPDPDPTPLEGVNTYLFTPTSAYMGLTQITDVTGLATYNLPDQEYKVRADFLGHQFWSDVFQWQDTILPIYRGTLELHIHIGGTDIVGATVYLFTESGAYLGLSEVSDENGNVSFLLPDRPYKFRIDYEGNQYWSDEITSTAGVTTPVDIDLTAPTVSFSADPEAISVGESAALTWTTTNAYSCSIQPDVGGVNVNGSVSVSPEETTLYTITATGPGGSVNDDVTVTVSIGPDIINVPNDYSTIQAAIDAAANGDTVQVESGTYMGTDNTNLDFGGKSITVTSINGPRSCTIDCNNSGRGFYFHSGESSDAIVSGFTIVNGNATEGGGILCQSASPTIKNCIIKDNTAQTMGAGIHCSDSSPMIENCVFMNNTGSAYGGGIGCSGTASPSIMNCTIKQNITTTKGGGIYAAAPDADPVIQNSIVWANTPDGLNDDAPPTVEITYSNVQGTGVYVGDGNINTDPLFFSHVTNDYHLSVDSPCIDAGTTNNAPAGDIDLEERPQSSGLDMGADEFKDTDADGLSDFHEVSVYGTDHLNWDSDGDGMPDGWEVNVGFDPLSDEASGDADSDGVFNYIEYKAQTDPNDQGDTPSITINYEYDNRSGVVKATAVLK